MSNYKKKPAAPRKNYDAEMIRDFIDHLLCELRAAHFEVNTSAEEAPLSDELQDQLRKYAKKYNCPGLLALGMVSEDDARLLTEEERRAAVAAYRAERRKQTQDAIGHLESLGLILAEAVTCAARTDAAPARNINLSEYLKKGRD